MSFHIGILQAACESVRVLVPATLAWSWHSRHTLKLCTVIMWQTVRRTGRTCSANLIRLVWGAVCSCIYRYRCVEPDLCRRSQSISLSVWQLYIGLTCNMGLWRQQARRLLLVLQGFSHSFALIQGCLQWLSLIYLKMQCAMGSSGTREWTTAFKARVLVLLGFAESMASYEVPWCITLISRKVCIWCR